MADKTTQSERRRSRRTAIAAIVLLTACGAEQDATTTSAEADTLTRRQRDSVIATMPIRGAGVVGRALDASDQAAERANVHDELAR